MVYPKPLLWWLATISILLSFLFTTVCSSSSSPGYCPTVTTPRHHEIRQDVDLSDSAKRGTAHVLVAVLESLSYSVSTDNHTTCELRPDIVLQLHDPVAYVIDQQYSGQVTSNKRTDWKLRIGYAAMDICQIRINGSLAVISSAMGGSECQRGRLCYSKAPASLAKVFMMLGPSSSATTSVVSPLLTALRLPTISPAATNHEFTCQAGQKSGARLSCQHHSSFYRTTSSDFYQAKAMIGLMTHFEWKLAITLSSDNIYGSSLMYAFGQEAAAHGVCVAFSTVITENNLPNIVQAIVSRPEVKVIVLLSTLPSARMIFDALARYSLEEQNGTIPRVWIGSDGWSNNRFLITNSTLRNITLASLLSISLAVHPTYRPVVSKLKKEFQSYIQQRRLTEVRANGTAFSCLATESIPQVNCSFCNSTCNVDTCQERYDEFASRIEDYLPFAETTLLAAEIAVRAVARAMDEIAGNASASLSLERLTERFLSKTAAGMDVARYLGEVELNCSHGRQGKCRPFRCFHELPPAYQLRTFTGNGLVFQETGMWSVNLANHTDDTIDDNCDNLSMTADGEIGSWNISLERLINWGATVNGTRPPISHCSTSQKEADCKPGQRHLTTDLLPCCIMCLQCKPEKFVNISRIGPRLCSECGIYEVPNANQTGCRLADPQPVDIISSTTMVALGLVGCAAVLFTAIVFHRHKDTPVVKGSDWRLTFIHMLGICGGFLSVVPRLWHPTVYGCVIQEAGGFLFFTITVAVSLVKTSRFARLVVRISLVSSSDWTFKNSAQIVYTFVLCLIGLLVYVPWRTLVPPNVGRSRQGYNRVFLYCDKVLGLRLVLDIYILVLIIITCILGFVTRKLPNNYNEARQVFMGSMTACILWLVTSSPYYADALDQSKADLFLAVRIIVHMWSMLLWLYAYRVYIILLKPEKNTKQMRRNSILQRTMTGESFTAKLARNGPPVALSTQRSRVYSSVTSNVTPTTTDSPTSSDEPPPEAVFVYPDPKWEGTSL